MNILVIAEHDNQSLAPVTYNIVTAASRIDNSDIHILIAGHECAAVAHQAATITGVNKILVADNPAYQHQLAENVAPLVRDIANENYSHIFSPATTTGKDILPRAAALLDVEPISEITSIESDNTFKRPIYAGNAIATVSNNGRIIVATVRGTAFDAAPCDDNDQAAIETLDITHNSQLSTFVSETLTIADRPDLTAARVVISGGRGMQSGENFALLEKLADKLDAAIGASRAAVDAGYVANDLQVGQTGKIVAPDLYIAVGISGAIQHLAGMKDSKIIVAINKDEEAPIFQVADYGLVGDLFEILPELEEKLTHK
jgi:electron transfer flavoprotein alpha subunit